MRVLMRQPPLPPCACEPELEAEPEPDNTLPIGMTDDGQLYWQAEVVSESDATSDLTSAASAWRESGED